jgi:predicted permease
MSRSFRIPFRSGSRIESEVDEELAFHLAAVAERLRNEGLSASEADAMARRQFGDVEYTRQYCRSEDTRREQETHRMTIAEEARQDLRYAFRSLRSAPGFTLIALATLALGIGANAAIFSVVRAVLLQPLPFATPDRIVRVWDQNPSAGIEEGVFSEPDFNDVRASSRLAESIGGYFFADGQTGLDLTGDGSPERLSAALVTPGFFETLRPRPVLGRVIAADEHEVGHNRVVVIGYGLWQRRFAGSPRIVGSTITLNGDPFTVVGVMGPGFAYPAGQSLDAWIPVSYFGPDAIGRVRAAHFISMIARLAPGVSPDRFRTEVSGILTRLSRSYPDNPGWNSAAVTSIRESIVGDVQRPLYVLVAAVAMVLLVTCVNIASLLLARASTRQRELAVRAALGAGRARIIRQLLTESLALALAGGALGALLAFVAVRALGADGGAELPTAGGLHVDGVVLGFTVLISLFAGLLFGAMPAFRAAGPALERSLRAGTRGSVGAPGQRLRSGLVVAEVALAVVLVVGAGLAAKSFARLLAVNPGFDTSNRLVVELHIPDRYSTEQMMRVYYRRILETIGRVPGVVSVASTKNLPMQGAGESTTADRVGLQDAPTGQGAPIQIQFISPGFFETMGVPVRGREFAWSDRDSTPDVFVVNQAAARRFWPGENVVGKIVHIGKSQAQIVGVVGDMRQRGLGEPADPTLYLTAMQNMRVGMEIVVRSQGDPLSLARAVRAAIWSMEPNQTIVRVTTMDLLLGGSVARQRLLAGLLGVFGFIGLTLGALGIYGVLAFAVAQRRQEIGVRTALGAPRSAVMRLVVGHGMMLTIVGAIAGSIAARVLTRQMQSVLFGITAGDAITFIQVIVVLLGVALLASWVPARRALAIDPATALRYD